MRKQVSYQQSNRQFLTDLAGQEGIKSLPKGILYKILQSGTGKGVTASSIVSVFYKGTLINGNEFDSNLQQGYPDAFRLSDLITGWQIALRQMRAGDKWRIYIPTEMGYGSQKTSGIPKNSTLIFEIELVSVA